jgi:hypothetical protein
VALRVRCSGGRDPEVWLRELLDRASDARTDKQRIKELLVGDRNIARARVDRRRTARSLFLAVFLALHGVAHFVGTTDSLRLASQSGSAGYAGGRWTISDPLALQMIALLWAVTGAFFVGVAILVWLKPSSARIPLAVAAVASLILSVAALPAAIVGVFIDIALLLVVWRPPGTLLGPRKG